MLRKYNHYVRLTLHVTAGPTNEFYDLDKAIDRVTHTCGVMCGVKAEDRTIPKSLYSSTHGKSMTGDSASKLTMGSRKVMFWVRFYSMLRVDDI